LAFAITLVVTITLVIAALLQRQDTGDIAGKWQLTSIGGVKMTTASGVVEQDIDVLQNGTFSWPSLSITGTWKADGNNLLLHPEKYDGKTAEQFRAETQAKFASDPAMQKIADKVFEDLKLSVGADYTTLSIDLGGNLQTYTKRSTK
jgi:hypothetical protein